MRYLLGLLILFICGCSSTAIDPLGMNYKASKGAKMTVEIGPGLGGAGVTSVKYENAEDLNRETLKYAKNNYLSESETNSLLSRIPAKGKIRLTLHAYTLDGAYLDMWNFIILDMNDKVITKHRGPKKSPSASGGPGWTNYHTIELHEGFADNFKLVVTYGSRKNEYHFKLDPK